MIPPDTRARVQPAAAPVRLALALSARARGHVTLADLVMLGTMLIWGINVVSVKVAVGVLPPLGFGLLRYTLATSGLFLLLWRREGSVLPPRRDLPWLCLAGFVGLGLNQIGFLNGIRLVSATMAAMILATSPLLTAAVAALWAREPLYRGTVVALLVSFGGVGVVILNGSAGLGVSWLGGLLLLASAAALAVGAVLVKPALRAITSLRVTSWLCLFSALTLAPAGLPALLSAPWASVPPLIWLATAFTVVGATILGNLAWNYAIQQLGATRTVAFTFLQPVAGVAAAAVLLGERLTWLQVLGGLVVLCGQILYSRQLRPTVGKE